MRGSPDFTQKEGDGIAVKRRSWIAVVLIVAVLSVSLMYAWQERRTLESGIRIYVVDVGQGDCMIIETSEGNVMIDTGPNVAESRLRGYLRSHGFQHFDYLILSHSHDDHIGNADMILREITVGRVLCSESTSTETAYSEMKQAIDESIRLNTVEWIRPKSGDVYWLGKLRIEILYAPPAENAGDNSDSLILRLDYGSCSMLLMGDAEAKEEEMLLETIPSDRLTSDFLKVAHHGSSGSSTEKLLSAVSPRIAVISSAEGNTFGHPHAEVLSRLEKINVDIYRTDIHGTLMFYCDGKRITLQRYGIDLVS